MVPRPGVGATMAEKKERLSGFLRSLLAGLLEGSEGFIAAFDMRHRYIAFNSAYQKEFEQIFGARLKIGMSALDVLAQPPASQVSVLELGRRGERFSETGEFREERSPNYYEQLISPIRN